MSQNTITSSGRIDLTGLLTILFVGLKLTHYIDWSWWWVFSPIWISFSVVIVGVIVFVLIAALGTK